MTAIQSFLHKPNLTEAQRAEIDKAIAYFQLQELKMIFGTSRDVTKEMMLHKLSLKSQISNSLLIT